MTSQDTTVNYDFIRNLFDKGFQNGKGWKSYYFKYAQNTFEKHFKPLNKWRPNPKDPKKWGHYNDDNLWSWTNRINTHPKCCLLFYQWAIKYNSNLFMNFGNPDYHDYNAKKMWEFLDKYFNHIFTTNITDKYHRQLKIMCQKSWNGGNLSSIAIILKLTETFGEVTEISHTYDYGDGQDMDGIDLTFNTNDGKKTMQIKSGKFVQIDDEFYISGSPNDLTYDVDYYGYANIDYMSENTSVIIFENNKHLYKENNKIIVKKEYVKYHNMTHMPIPEKLNELFILCCDNSVEYILQKENDINSINFDIESKIIVINFIDYEDKEMEKLLDSKISELKELFK